VVVVDNADEDACARLAAAHGATYVGGAGNLGYAAAVNRGLERLDSDLVLVVNPDVVLLRDPRTLSSWLGADGVVSGRVTTPASAPTAGPDNVHPLPSTGREILRALVSYRAYRWRTPLDAPTAVPQADGAYLLAARTTWRSLGGLDDRYELYYEDVALGRTLWPGRRLILVPDVVATHVGGHSARRSGGLSYTLLGVSRVRYYHLSGMTRAPRLLGASTSVVEYLVRTVTRRPEGDRRRWEAVRLQLREALHPGTVWLLGGPRPMDRS
jgi:N-acetylglucosaminyl-diphospho-decaprenol L-rhamnosyltransferase